MDQGRVAAVEAVGEKLRRERNRVAVYSGS